MTHKTLAYWWAGNDPKNPVSNFGDSITPLLLKWYTGIEASWAPVGRADVVVTGSILEHIPPMWEGAIVGAGKLYPDSRLHLHTRTAKVFLIRGPLSAKVVPGDFALGDPGLLFGELVADDVETRDIELGIVPHMLDKTLAKRQEFYNSKWKTQVISPLGDPLEVLRQIKRCKRIVTSSLHGLIAADACQVPRRLEHCPALDKDGGDFKFIDYSLSISTPLEFGRMIEARRFYVEDRAHEVYDGLMAYRDYVEFGMYNDRGVGV